MALCSICSKITLVLHSVQVNLLIFHKKVHEKQSSSRASEHEHEWNMKYNRSLGIVQIKMKNIQRSASSRTDSTF